MATVFTVQADMTGNAASLIAASKAGSNAIKDFKRAADDANGGMDNLGNGFVRAAGKGVNAITAVLATVAKVGIAAAAVGVTAATAFAFKGAQAGLQRLEDIQDATVSLTRMLGSQQAAADLTAKALKVVQGTPFAFPAFAEATRQLVAFGVSAEKVPGVLQAIADSAAASGQGADAVTGLTQAFSKLQVQGKVSLDVLQSFGVAGVNGLALLGNAFGKNTQEMQDMISYGYVPADKAMQILVDGIEKGSDGINGHFNAISGAAQDLGKTVSGSLGNVKAAFARMGASWLKPFQDDLPNVLNNGVIPLLDKLGKTGQLAMQKIADTGVLSKALTLFQSLQKNIDPLWQTFQNLMRSLSPLNVVWEALKKVLPQVQQVMADASRTVVGSLIPAVADLIKAAVPLIPVLANIVDMFAHGLVAAVPAVTFLIQGAIPVLNQLVGLFESLPSPLQGVIVSLIALNKVGVPLGDWVSNAISRFSDLGGKFADVTSGVDGFSNKLSVAKGAMGGFQGVLGGFSNFLGGPWGIALGTAATVIGAAFIENIPQAAKNIDELRGSLDQATGALTKMTEASVVQALQQAGAFDAAKKFGVNLKDVVKAAEGDVDASKRVADQMNKVQDAANKAADANSNLSGKANALRGDYNTLAQAIGGQTAAVKDAVSQQQNWLQATGASKNAQDAVKASLDQFNSTLAANGKVTDTSSAAYKSNLLALNELGGKAKDYITTVQNQTHSVNDTTAAQGSMIAQLYNSARQMGMNSAEADKYIGKLLGIPTSRVTTLRLDNSQALNAIATTAAALQRMQALANAGAAIVANTTTGRIAQENGGIVRTGAQAFADGGMRAYASGGLATGIYAARNPGVIKFAEPSTRWEAYISGKPGQEERNIGIAVAALKKLGVDFDGMGGGSRGDLTVNNHNYGVDPQVTADLISQNILAKIGW